MTRVMALSPHKAPQPMEIDMDDLRTMQTFVGGYIEFYALCGGLSICCDEEGKVKEKRPHLNKCIAGDNGYSEMIFGPAFICHADGSDMTIEECEAVEVACNKWVLYLDILARELKACTTKSHQ